MDGFLGFSDTDFSAYSPEKWSSHVFNRQRQAVREKLRRLGQRLLSEVLPGLTLGLSPEYPSPWNNRQVQDQWLFFVAGTPEEQRYRERFSDQERSISNLLEDPLPEHKHLCLALCLSETSLRAGLVLWRRAAVDARNLAALLAQPEAKERFSQLTGPLSSLVWLAEDGTAISPSEIAESPRPFSAMRAFSRDEILAMESHAGDTLAALFASLLPVQAFASWTRHNDALGLVGQLEEEAKARAAAQQREEEERQAKERERLEQEAARAEAARAESIRHEAAREAARQEAIKRRAQQEAARAEAAQREAAQPSTPRPVVVPVPRPAQPPAPRPAPQRPSEPRPARTEEPRRTDERRGPPRPGAQERPRVDDRPRDDRRDDRRGPRQDEARRDNPREERREDRRGPAPQQTQAAQAPRPAPEPPKPAKPAAPLVPAEPGSLKTGDRVQLLAGPFTGKVGVIQELDHRREAKIALGKMSVKAPEAALAKLA